jgi:hypothetical protein
MRRPIAPVVTATALALVLPASGHASDPSWDDLEARKAVVVGIEIVVTDVFDVRQPSDDTWLGRAANAVHVQTRRGVVARELLFAAGDTVDARRIRETERNLRRYSFVRDARIAPDRVADHSVWARVEVFDAWSLDAGVALSRAGGTTVWSVSADEANVFGSGKRLGVSYGRTRERSTTDVTYTDPQLLSSRWTAALSYADYSDGASRGALLERPYYAIEAPYAAGGFISTAEYSLTQYHLGAPVYAIPSRQSAAALFASRAHLVGGDTALRFGVTFRSRRTEYGRAMPIEASPLPASPASSQRFRGVAATWSVVQDRAATFTNLASIGHVEDFNLGWTASAEGGYYSKAFGGDTSAPFADVALRKGWRLGERGLVLTSGGLRGRRETSGWRDAVTWAELTAYDRSLSWQTLAVSVQVVSVTRPDPVSWLYLDSRAGLRGYPDRFLAGDRRIVVSFDDRIITEWRLLGLLQVGFVAYADAGAIRRFGTGRWSRTYANVGGGLRFGSLKGSRGNVMQASLAVPVVRDAGLARVQLVLGNSVRF